MQDIYKQAKYIQIEKVARVFYISNSEIYFILEH